MFILNINENTVHAKTKPIKVFNLQIADLLGHKDVSQQTLGCIINFFSNIRGKKELVHLLKNLGYCGSYERSNTLLSWLEHPTGYLGRLCDCVIYLCGL